MLILKAIISLCCLCRSSTIKHCCQKSVRFKHGWFDLCREQGRQRRHLLLLPDASPLLLPDKNCTRHAPFPFIWNPPSALLHHYMISSFLFLFLGHRYLRVVTLLIIHSVVCHHDQYHLLLGWAFVSYWCSSTSVGYREKIKCSTKLWDFYLNMSGPWSVPKTDKTELNFCLVLCPFHSPLSVSCICLLRSETICFFSPSPPKGTPVL